MYQLENRIGLRQFNVIREHFFKVINGQFFRDIRWCLFNVIRGLKPANLDCRITSGNDSRVKCVTYGNDICCSGRSMIEMLGVLAIIGVLSVGGIAGYSKAMTKFKTNQVADQVSTIVTNIKTLYAQQKSYKGLDRESAMEMGAIPDELGSYPYNLTNPFNGRVYVSSDINDENTFIVSYDELPKEACISLVTNDWGASVSSGLVAVAAAGTGTSVVLYNANEKYMHIGCQGIENGVYNTYVACSGGSVLSVPMSPDKATAACACDEGNTCSVGWMYY